MSATTGYPAEGDEVGPFRVVRRIGDGGMGAVFEAVDTTLGRRVALKVIVPHLAEDPEFRRRFTAEAQALAALDSPHVVQVYTHGDQAGCLYIATQLIPDGDLAHLIEAVGVPPLRAGLELIGQVAAGLADVHAVGLVHRDIKPANVLLRHGDGGAMSAYLGDFGVACRVGAERASDPTGTIGTPAWMAPELHSGTPAGVASDVYSLGCLLWATLTGRAPYAGTTDDQVVSAHREQPVPQLVGATPITREVNRILRTAMAKDPAVRQCSAAELRDDLRRAVALPDAVAGEPAVARRTLSTAAVLLAAVVAGSTAQVTSTPPDGASPTRAVATSTPDRARAVASLARTLADKGVMSRAEAECTARRWIEKAGLGSMVAAGFFDEEVGYVDRDPSAMTPRIESAATAAARTCATAG